MRNLALMALMWAVLALMTTGCGGSAKLSTSGKAEVALVEAFVQEQVKYADYGVLWTYISPKYIKEQKLDTTQWMVDRYSPAAAEAAPTTYDPKTGTVWAYLFFDDNTAHCLRFVVVKENGKLYLWPGKRMDDVNYIAAWHGGEFNVKKSPSKN